MDSHPVFLLLNQYVNDFPALKERHEDLDNVSFNRNHGLFLDLPNDYPTYDCVVELLEWSVNSDIMKNVLIVYSTTVMYDRISKPVSNSTAHHRVSYFSWHELAVAMNRASVDMQHIRSLRNKIESADLVIFLGAASAIQDVIDQVRGFCTSCLILLG